MNISLLSVTFALSAAHAHADWRVEVFDEAQALDKRQNDERKAVVLEKHPDLTAYYDQHVDVLWGFRSRLNRMAFLYLLEASPSEINWENDHWYLDYRFPEEEREARYIRFIPGYQELRDQLYKHHEQTRHRWQWAQDTQMKDIHAREDLKPLLVEISEKYKVLWKSLHARVSQKISEQEGGANALPRGAHP